MSSYKNENENNVQINPKILSLVYTTHKFGYDLDYFLFVPDLEER